MTSALLLAIDVTPASVSIPVGLTQAFTATGTFSDGSTAAVTGNVLWSSTDATVAPVSNAAGEAGAATGKSVGHVTITARDPSALFLGVGHRQSARHREA